MASSLVRNVAAGATGLAAGLPTRKHRMEEARLRCPLRNSFKGLSIENRRRHMHPSITQKRSIVAAAEGVKSPGLMSEKVYPGLSGTASPVFSMANIETPYSAFMGDIRADGQGPPPQMIERFQGVISQLFQHRIIRCGGAVDDDMANIIVAQLLYLDAADPNKDIIMYVNSPGGSVTAGMAIFDTMRHIRCDVSTVCVGLAASMGAFLLSGGTKGKRYALPNARIMIHQPLGGAQGQQTDVEIQANEILHHKANLNGYLAYHTGQSLDKIVADTDRDFFLSSKEAMEYGLIDGVISNPLKALNPASA